MDISTLRREFESTGLSRSMLDQNPIAQFTQWLNEAESGGISDMTACSVATASRSGQPSLRTLLLKGFDERGFVFYTNYGSRKARDLADNPQAAMLFPWLALNRQVIIEGTVEKVTEEESALYFRSRPRGSQLGAWGSQQSTAIESRAQIEAKLESLRERFAEGDIPLPSFWGGYRLLPTRIEFWQGRPNRVHDRFEYRRDEKGWQISRLQP